MPTTSAHYYEPRPAHLDVEQPIVMETADDVSYVELIAMALGILVFGFALGMVITATILGGFS
jgi:hypothetical protein